MSNFFGIKDVAERPLMTWCPRCRNDWDSNFCQRCRINWNEKYVHWDRQNTGDQQLTWCLEDGACYYQDELLSEHHVMPWVPFDVAEDDLQTVLTYVREHGCPVGMTMQRILNLKAFL